mmetsp:Transcript_29956/g.74843  ORF Transcript_29956/g.74843 Transcript_29956/m.74843 type:complete len:222 (-) Transcript_29956:146-811(-)
MSAASDLFATGAFNSSVIKPAPCTSASAAGTTSAEAAAAGAPSGEETIASSVNPPDGAAAAAPASLLRGKGAALAAAPSTRTAAPSGSAAILDASASIASSSANRLPPTVLVAAATRSAMESGTPRGEGVPSPRKKGRSGVSGGAPPAAIEACRLMCADQTGATSPRSRNAGRKTWSRSAAFSRSPIASRHAAVVSYARTIACTSARDGGIVIASSDERRR